MMRGFTLQAAYARRGAHWTFNSAAFVNCVRKVRAAAGTPSSWGVVGHQSFPILCSGGGRFSEYNSRVIGPDDQHNSVEVIVVVGLVVEVVVPR
jgi:pantothenate kinase